MRWLNRQLGLITYAFLVVAILSEAVPRVDAAVSLGKIMPLGDSITYGNSTPSDVPGGYRDRLNTDLKNAGYSFTSVGSHTSNPSTQLTTDGQTRQEGHGSYQVDMITNNLDGNPSGLPGPNYGGYWLTGTGDRGPVDPDFVLLHIGTNDILNNIDLGNGGNDTSHLQTRLKNLITRIVTLRPNVNVIVSTVIPIAKNGMKDHVLTYNKAIRTVIVPDFVAAHKRVTYVDNYKNFVDANGNILGWGDPNFISPPLSSDGVHPTQAGYNLMGDTWAAGIKAITPTPEPSSVVLLITGLLGLLAYAWRKRR